MDNMLLKIGPYNTIFSQGDNQTIEIHVGYQQLIEQHFKHSRPTGYEVEMAIITIEDAIESMQSLLKIKTLTNVRMAKQDITDIIQLINVEQRFSAAELEYGFNRVADIVMGSPTHSNEFPDSVEFISKLLILRELMHHLQIEEVVID